MAPTSVEELRGLLDRVNEATRTLRGSEGEITPFVESVVEGLDTALHADAPERLDVDPHLAKALFAGALRAMKALRHDVSQARYRDLRIALEQVSHALRDTIDGAPFAGDVPSAEVAARLKDAVPVSQPELAALVGVSTRQWQRWLTGKGQPSPDDAARLRMVAQVADQLRHAFTAPGVVAWFRRPHPVLGVPPLDLLADPARHPELVAAARRSRATLG